MGKVFGYFNEQGNNEEPCCVPVMETGRCACGSSEPTKVDIPGFEGTWDALDDITTEPTDTELMDIEINLDDMLWDDDDED